MRISERFLRFFFLSSLIFVIGPGVHRPAAAQAITVTDVRGRTRAGAAPRFQADEWRRDAALIGSK